MLAEYLNANNLHKYVEYLDGDIADNIGREFYRGIIVQSNDKPGAALIWELIDLYEDEKPTLSRIEWGKVTDDEMGEFLVEAYSNMIARDKVSESFFELNVDYDRTFIKLMKSAGFNITRDKCDMITVRLSDAETAIKVNKLHVLPYIKSLEDLSTRDFNKAIRECVYNIKRDLVPDLLLLGIDWYEQDISCFAEAGQQCSGFLLVHRCPSGVLRIELLADWGAEPQKNLLGMIRYSLERALELYPADIGIEVVLRDDASRELVSYLFPQISVSKCIRGDRRES